MTVKHWNRFAQRGCGVSIFGDTQNPNRHGHEQLVLVDPALSTEVEPNDSEVPSHFSNSVTYNWVPLQEQHFVDR